MKDTRWPCNCDLQLSYMCASLNEELLLLHICAACDLLALHLLPIDMCTSVCSLMGSCPYCKNVMYKLHQSQQTQAMSSVGGEREREENRERNQSHKSMCGVPMPKRSLH